VPPSAAEGGTLRRRLADIDHRPRRALGQHFLADPGIARKIVDLARIREEDRVIEIGPGLGALTDLLAARASRLLLIEYDSDLAQELRARYSDRPHVEVLEADALEVDFRTVVDGDAIVVANLPYNVATPILARLLDRRELFSRIVVMIQREVAERLRARPGSKAYGALSLLTQLVADVQRGFAVRPSAFVPRPKVDSEVIVVEPSAELRAAVDDFQQFRRVVQTAFGQRRKQLANSLRGLTDDPASVLAGVGIDPHRRPETLSLEEAARLSNALGRLRDSADA
jgi:16S rRNA (adenine1518-N6/adenine1519-N6)-dimethyltransferase